MTDEHGYVVTFTNEDGDEEPLMKFSGKGRRKRNRLPVLILHRGESIDEKIKQVKLGRRQINFFGFKPCGTLLRIDSEAVDNDLLHTAA